MHILSSVYFVKHLYMFRAYLQPIIRMYILWRGSRCARNMWRCLTKYTEDKLVSFCFLMSISGIFYDFLLHALPWILISIE